MKHCAFCGKYFEPNPDRHNHNQIYCCKKCNKKAYYYSEKGRATSARALKKTMERYHNDLEFNKHWKEKNRKYAISEKGKISKTKYRKKYRKTEKGILINIRYSRSDKRKVSLKRYTNSGKGKENSMRASIKRRSNKKKIKHNYTYIEWMQKKKNTFGVCPRCNKWVGINKLSLDHIIPITKVPEGFTYTINDVQPLCRSCNSSKNNRIE